MKDFCHKLRELTPILKSLNDDKNIKLIESLIKSLLENKVITEETEVYMRADYTGNNNYIQIEFTKYYLALNILITDTGYIYFTVIDRVFDSEEEDSDSHLEYIHYEIIKPNGLFNEVIKDIGSKINTYMPNSWGGF